MLRTRQLQRASLLHDELEDVDVDELELVLESSRPTLQRKTWRQQTQEKQSPWTFFAVPDLDFFAMGADGAGRGRGLEPREEGPHRREKQLLLGRRAAHPIRNTASVDCEKEKKKMERKEKQKKNINQTKTKSEHLIRRSQR